MCVMCKGATREEFFRCLQRQIADRGFTVMSIGTRLENKGWAYTIGLIDSKDHPELVVAGYPLGRAAGILRQLGAAVVAGDRLDLPGDHLVFYGAEIGARAVHERHLQGGLMATWHSYYDSVGRYDLVLRAVQIVLPDGHCCFEHHTSQPRLDGSHRVPFDGLTRQQRRARPNARRGR
jgi:hypothetical protein